MTGAGRGFWLLAAAAITAALSAAAPAAAQSQTPRAETLDDVVVTGRRLEEAVRQYVETLSAPPRTRGLARWDTPICVDVVNFQAGAEREIADRIRDVAGGLGVAVEEAGCDPNLVIMGSDDGRDLANSIVGRYRARFFRLGYSRSNRGSDALERFRTGDDPVRWWHVSLPVHAVTGEPMIRLPGRSYVTLPCHSRSTATADLSVAGLGGSRTGRRCNAVTDRLVGLWIIVDVTRASELSVAQLSDYLAFVAMAQVDPEADMSSFETVLNLFEAPDEVSGITAWDETYLVSLYSGRNERIDTQEQAERMLGVLPPPAPEPERP